MLTKLLPDQISKFWNIISYALDQSPPITLTSPKDWKNRILSSALSGKIIVWASYTKGEVNKFEGLALTTILHDDLMMANSLLIYYVYGYTKVSESSWKEGIIALAKYAKSKNCLNIVAYTNDEKLIEVVKLLEAKADITFITFDIDRCINNLTNYIGE